MSGPATLERVPTASVVASPDQNRTVFDPAGMAELAASIDELGLLQPIVVRRDGASFVLIAGERRLRAVVSLGWVDVPAIVHDDPPEDTAALRTLAENMVRVDPGPLEEALGLAQASARYGLDGAELARRLGKSPRWVRGRLALLRLADDVAHFVQVGSLPLERAVLMAELDVNRQRLALAAHERGLGIDAFRALVGRLADDQAAECMFDPDAFLALETYVAEAEAIVEAEESPVIQVRETPLGIMEIAELLEVRRPTVDQWVRRGVFPEPDLRVSGTPLWWPQTVTEWASRTGRMPGPI